MEDYTNDELEQGSKEDVDEQREEEDEEGGLQDSEAGSEENEVQASGGATLTGTGLSSESEDAEASGEENASGVLDEDGEDPGVAESGENDEDGAGEEEQLPRNVKAAMEDLFGDEEDDDDDDDQGGEEGADEEEEAGGEEEAGVEEGAGGEEEAGVEEEAGGEEKAGVEEEAGGEKEAGGDAGDRGRSGSGGRYGTLDDGESSNDENTFDDRGRIRGGNGSASSTAEALRGSSATGVASSVFGSDDEEGDEGEGGEEETPPPALPDRELRIPALPRPPPGADVAITRLPNILGIKSEAFDPDTFEEEAEAAEFKFTTNIIRWRYKRDSLGRLELGEDGLPLRETNTRLVKWSDGSIQLLVGDEAFDVGEHPIDRSALFVQQMTEEGSVLQCQGHLSKKISFKPSNVLSKAHRTLTLAVRKRAVKGSTIKKYAETIDPEKVKQERARAQEAENKQLRRRNREYARHPGDWRPGRASMDIGYLEAGAASGTFDSTSTRAIKSDSKAGRYDDMTSDPGDEEDEDEEDEATQMAQLRARRAASSSNSRAAAPAAAADEDSEEEDGERTGRGTMDREDQDDEDEDDQAGMAGSKRPRDDFEEEHSPTGAPEGKRRNRIEDSDSD